MNMMDNPKKLTLGQAAKASKRAKSTVLLAIRSGRMSAPMNDKKEYEIDPAELFRVFQPVHTENTDENQIKPHENDNKTLENGFLKDKIKQLQEIIDDLNKLITPAKT